MLPEEAYWKVAAEKLFFVLKKLAVLYPAALFLFKDTPLFLLRPFSFGCLNIC